MTKDGANAAFAFLSYYAKKFEERYGLKPTINKYKEKWAASSILDDYGKEQSYLVIDYYFKLNKEGHPLNWLYNNFDSLLETMKQNEQDEILRKQRREETARLREEWLNGNA